MLRFTHRTEALGRQILDGQRDRAPAAMLNCAAHMLFRIDDPAALSAVALDYLLETLGGTRADIGLVAPDDAVYRPSFVRLRPGADAPDFSDLALPNQDPGIQVVWNSAGPVYLDVERSPVVRHLRPVLRDGLGTRAKLSRRIDGDGRAFGIVCLDETENARRWTQAERARFDLFVSRFLAPILAESLRPAKIAARLTPAERAVLELAAAGLTYKEIARRLDKSPHTVDNQLRGLRAKLGARNQVELLRFAATLA